MLASGNISTRNETMNLRDAANVRHYRWQCVLTLMPLLIAPAWGDATRDRHPSDPATPAPAIEYRSVFANYQSLLDSERKSWRRANEEAGESGGHVSHFMQRRQQPEDSEPASEKKPEATSPHGGGGHSGH